MLKPVARAYQELSNDPMAIRQQMKAGADRARSIASPMIKKVREATGLTVFDI